MPKQKVIIAPIENRESLQVAHSKRTKGIMQKAKELAVMCNAQVAVVIFSAAHKLKLFPRPDSGSQYGNLDQIISRWEAHKREVNGARNSKVKKQYEELKAKLSAEQLIASQMRGEEINTLPFEELEKLEEKMEASLTAVKKEMEKQSKI